MLSYLTHKLRTQSLNESEAYHVKTDDDRDSGTESDDEGAEIEELQKYMETIIHLDSSRRRTKRLPLSQVTKADCPPPPPPRNHHQNHRHHHRRHNRSPGLPDSALPSDSDLHHSSEEELEVINNHHHLNHHHHPEKRKWVGHGEECCPVEFRTEPPDDVYKPSKCVRQAHIPPHELCAVSPRKRHRRTPVVAIQRPCLDFEKMQQINRVRLL